MVIKADAMVSVLRNGYYQKGMQHKDVDSYDARVMIRVGHDTDLGGFLRPCHIQSSSCATFCNTTDAAARRLAEFSSLPLESSLAAVLLLPELPDFLLQLFVLDRAPQVFGRLIDLYELLP